MRYDQSVRACKSLLDRGYIGDAVLATIDMRAIPHWMPWQQRQGWMTCRIMSIHHLDTIRFWFGDPTRVYASFRQDPRTEFAHVDGIGLYILEYESNRRLAHDQKGTGLRCMICDDVWTGPAREGAAEDIGIRWRVEGTKGMARGTIGWPNYPERTPSTIDFTTVETGIGIALAGTRFGFRRVSGPDGRTSRCIGNRYRSHHERSRQLANNGRLWMPVTFRRPNIVRLNWQAEVRTDR